MPGPGDGECDAGRLYVDEEIFAFRIKSRSCKFLPAIVCGSDGGSSGNRLFDHGVILAEREDAALSIDSEQAIAAKFAAREKAAEAVLTDEETPTRT